MRLVRVLGVTVAIGALLLLGAGPASHAATVNTYDEISISGPVDPLVARYVDRSLRTAAHDHAEFVLVRLDTPGGLDSSMRHIVKAIGNATVPVVCWVGPSGARAASAGAFILIGCPVAAMAPGTNTGAAHPVGITGQVLSDKVTNDAAAYIRSLAQRWNRNADWAERAVRHSVSVSADEALSLHVIDFVAADRAAVIAALGGRVIRTGNGDVTFDAAVLAQDRHSLHMTWGERLLHALVDANVAFLFFVLGLAGVVYEVFHPGIRIPAVLGVLLFLIALVILGMLPVTIAGMFLLVAGMALFAVGVKVHGHGIPHGLAAVLIVLGGLFLYDPSVPNARVSRILLAIVALKLAAFFLLVVRATSRTRHAPVQTGREALVGADGVVVRDLDPDGTVRARGETWTARTAGEHLPAGTPVRVVAVDGLTLEVQPTATLPTATKEVGS